MNPDDFDRAFPPVPAGIIEEMKRLAEERDAARKVRDELVDALRLAVLWAKAKGYDGTDRHQPEWVRVARKAIIAAGGNAP